MSLDHFKQVLQQLIEVNVVKVTLTGGEPTIHPEFKEILALLAEHQIEVGVCTNGVVHDETLIDSMTAIGAHVNVSLDGFRTESHGKFRGNPDSFKDTINGIRTYAKAGLLNGLLVTPNNLAELEEYVEIHEFAKDIGAKYVLMNPLSPFGRGAKSQGPLGTATAFMQELANRTAPFGESLDLVQVRFPTEEPLSPCEAGNILYVFQTGDVTVCPYLTFAAQTAQSKYADDHFIVGNALTSNLREALEAYPLHERTRMGENPTCGSCELNDSCGKGCPAALVGMGQSIGEKDPMCEVEIDG